MRRALALLASGFAIDARSGTARVAAWLQAPAPPLPVAAVAAALGLATCLVVYGPSHLVGAASYWELPQADERMALMGYRYFLHQPWGWPVFANHAIDVPYSTSVAFWDCIPLWALINKSIATVVPPWGSFSADAYLGLWHALVYALQACLGVAILRALGHQSWRAAIVGALLFVALPAFIFRYGHPALSAHWIELWALYLYLRTPARAAAPRSLGIAKLVQLVVASLVTPYHAVMSLGIFVASLVRARRVRTVAIWIPLGLTCVALALWFAGYFAPAIRIPQWGFEVESANVLAWLVPVRSGIIGDGRWIANVTATEWQYEGYAYLGLGCLGLFAVSLTRVRELAAVIRRHAALFAVALGFWLFALSSHVYLGSHRIATYSIRAVVPWIAQQFRSPGRFVWVPMYVLVAFVLHRALARFSTGWRFAIVVVAVAIQLVDARGEWADQRARTEGPQGAVLDRDAWRPLVHAHHAVLVYPTYACLYDPSIPALESAATQIHMLASERGLPINGTYSTRPTRKCAAEERAWPAIDLRRGVLYIVAPRAIAIADRLAARGARCGALAYGRACSTDEPAIAAAIRAGILQQLPE